MPPEPLKLGRVDAVASIVTKAVCDWGNEGWIAIEKLQDTVCQIYVLNFVAATDVVDLSVLSLLDE